MSVKVVVQQQLQRLLNEAAQRATIVRPPGGWLQTTRKALGMSGPQLAKIMNVTRGRIAQAEANERRGTATLQSMERVAAAMGCRFVYAIVPPGKVEDLILAEARKKATAIVTTASRHMALEDQSLPGDKISAQVERLAQELAQNPSELWDKK